MHPASYLQSRDPLLDNPLLPDGIEWTDNSGSAPYPRYVLDGGAWVQVGGGGATVDGKRIATIMVVADATTLTTGDGKASIFIPAELDGYNLVDADACVSTAGTGATLTTVQVRNVTDAVDMLSTRITIDASELTSFTAATQPVIDTTKDDVATGDQLAIDVDLIANTTAPKGLQVILVFEEPV